MLFSGEISNEPEECVAVDRDKLRRRLQTNQDGIYEIRQAAAAATVETASPGR